MKIVIVIVLAIVAALVYANNKRKANAAGKAEAAKLAAAAKAELSKIAVSAASSAMNEIKKL